MCLFPGTLAPGPARPSERALRLARAAQAVSVALGTVSVLLVLSFSVGCLAGNMFFMVFAYLNLRRFNVPDALVQVESIFCFATTSLLQGALVLLNFVALANGKQDFNDKLEQWQITTGLSVLGVCVACYLVLTLLGFMLAIELRKDVIPLFNDERLPFVTQSTELNRGDSRRSTFSQPPVGSYVPASQTATRHDQSSRARVQQEPPRSDAERFPGKGYRLNA